MVWRLICYRYKNKRLIDLFRIHHVPIILLAFCIESFSFFFFIPLFRIPKLTAIPYPNSPRKPRRNEMRTLDTAHPLLLKITAVYAQYARNVKFFFNGHIFGIFGRKLIAWLSQYQCDFDETRKYAKNGNSTAETRWQYVFNLFFTWFFSHNIISTLP